MEQSVVRTVEVKRDADGELYIEIPEEYLKELGWKIDDELDIEVEDKNIILKKKNNELKEV